MCEFVLFNQSRIKCSIWYWVRLTDIPELSEEFITSYLNAGNLPTIWDRYYIQWQIYWNQIYNAHRLCSQVNPGERPWLDDVRDRIEKKEKKQQTVPLALSQATTLEIYDRTITTGAIQNYNQLPENDGTAAWTFMLKNRWK